MEYQYWVLLFPISTTHILDHAYKEKEKEKEGNVIDPSTPSLRDYYKGRILSL
jgi:hypothetical protein